MGSSKKQHKEKRDRKKHKKGRSRSRERDHKKSHKSSRRKEKRKGLEHSSPEFEFQLPSERKRHVSGEDEMSFREYAEVEKHEGNRSPKRSRDLSPKRSRDLSPKRSRDLSPKRSRDLSPKRSRDLSPEDDLDIDKLLDSKLSENSEFSSSRHLSRKRKRDDSEDESKKRENFGINEDSLEKFANEQLLEEHGYQPLAEGIVSEQSPKKEWLSSDKQVEIPFISDTKIKEEPPEENISETEEHHEPQLSLSISETNKLRAKLGLKPLDVGNEIPGLTSENAEKEVSKPAEVFVKTENISEVKKSEALREKLKVIKEKRVIEEKLKKTKGVADSDSEDESAAAWVLKHQKLLEEKEQAEKRAKLLEEMDEEFGVGALVEEEFDKKKTYTAQNLKGLTIGHGIDVFKEGHQVILTLKDKGVLEEEDDVLENVNIVDNERYSRNIENKKRKPEYRAYDEPEYDEFGILKKKSLLSKYDEEIEGEKKKSFKIGNISSTPYVSKEQELELIRMKLKQQNEMSLEMPELKIANEYYTAEDMVQFKKPKKKRKLRKPALLKADELLPDALDDSWKDFGSRRARKHRDDDAVDEKLKQYENKIPLIGEEDAPVVDDLSNVVIDEEKSEKELHSALHKAKKLKQRKPMTTAPEKVIEMLNSVNGSSVDSKKDPKTGNIELNSIAEFCRTLGEIPTYGMSGNRDEEADEMMDLERDLLEERQKQELEAQNRGAWNEVDIDEKPAEISMRENEPILEEEPDISLGIAGALKLATKKGYLDKDTKKASSAARASQLQAQSYTIEEKFYEDDKFGKRDRYTGPVQEFKEKTNYRPDVKLEYIDDSGRLLTAKEAFRYLSHKFHGKGPGKNKVDKRMKKLEQDTRLKQMSSTDTPLNTVKLLQAKQKETQSPYIVLSGGNKTLTQTMISKTKFM